MLYAIKNNEKITATISGDRALCPTCSEEVVAKCGTIMIHHWAHKTNSLCVGSGETSWHLSWKSIAHPDNVEVAIGNHRADIVLADKSILELQHSYISTEDIDAREEEYEKLTWLLDFELDPKIKMKPANFYNPKDTRFKAAWKGKLPIFFKNGSTVFLQLRNDEEYVYQFIEWHEESYSQDYYGNEWHPKTVVFERWTLQEFLQTFFDSILNPALGDKMWTGTMSKIYSFPDRKMIRKMKPIWWK